MEAADVRESARPRQLIGLGSVCRLFFAVQNPNPMEASMSNISPFQFQSHSVRTTLDAEGNAWFIAKDVCDVLGIQNVSDTLAKVVDDDEKGVDIVSTPGGPQTMATVNEPGLYRLIMRSRKKVAKAFQRWVLHDVLPAIRKTGGYQAQPAAEAPDLSAQIEAAVAKALAEQAAQASQALPEPPFAHALKAGLLDDLSQRRSQIRYRLKLAMSSMGNASRDYHQALYELEQLKRSLDKNEIKDVSSLSQMGFAAASSFGGRLHAMREEAEAVMSLALEGVCQFAERKALRLRVAKLEAAPKAKAAVPAVPAKATLSESELWQLKEMVHAKASVFPEDKQQLAARHIWKQLHAQFQIRSYENIPAGAFAQAVEAIRLADVSRYAPVGQTPPPARKGKEARC